MRIFLFTFMYFIATFGIIAHEYPHSSSIADCDGAANMPVKGEISIGFPSEPGIFFDLNQYDTKHKETNSIWLYFTAEMSGFLNLSFMPLSDEVEIFFFKSSKDQICDKVSAGKIEPSFSVTLNNRELNMTSKNENHSFLNLERGETIWVYINHTNKKTTDKIRGKVNFQVTNETELNTSSQNSINLSRKKDAPKLKLSFQSNTDQTPVIAEVVIKNSKTFDALYNASEIIIDLERSLKFDLKVDAVGYFPKDTSFRITEIEDLQIPINLEPVLIGSQMKLEGIEFYPESNDLTPEAKVKLKRIRDFLVVNADLKIEVQGHVNQSGKNTFRAKSLSRKRAKSVRDYLISSGIKKSRVQFKGYGNEFMIYPEANTPEEKQANRRVEIKIL